MKKNNKGFTLIEIIVVLIIIAILAAIAVPAMMKYINDAKEKQYLAEARSLFIAGQSAIADLYASDLPISDYFTTASETCWFDDITLVYQVKRGNLSEAFDVALRKYSPSFYDEREDARGYTMANFYADASYNLVYMQFYRFDNDNDADTGWIVHYAPDKGVELEILDW